MNKQPEALRLAECLDDLTFTTRGQATDAAAELRRLHAENEQLRAGLGHPPAVDQPQGEQLKGCHKIEKPCRVGKWNFGVGNLCRRVIEEAQRQYNNPQPKHDPMTDEQIAAATGAKPGTPMWLVAVAFTRAIEAAHNIK